MSDHIGDLAALYALGALDDHERSRVDAHAERCDACTRLLGQAEDDSGAIFSLEPQHDVPDRLRDQIERLLAEPAPEARTFAPPPRRWNSALAAMAALLILAILPSAYLLKINRSMHDSMLAESAAMARMTSGPHRMVAFSGTDGVDGKVVYGADGSWYCVIVKGISAPLHVLWMHDGQRTMLGTAQTHGDVATLYLPVSHRMETLALSDGERVVAEAKLVF